MIQDVRTAQLCFLAPSQSQRRSHSALLFSMFFVLRTLLLEIDLLFEYRVAFELRWVWIGVVLFFVIAQPYLQPCSTTSSLPPLSRSLSLSPPSPLRSVTLSVGYLRPLWYLYSRHIDFFQLINDSLFVSLSFPSSLSHSLSISSYHTITFCLWLDCSIRL